MSLLEVQDLHTSFFTDAGEVKAVNGVSFFLDKGKVLGMELRPRLSGRPLVVLDELKLADGDYLDMGKPLYQGGVVPVTIKSLAFSG